jgi:hypothetical protein
VRSVVDPEGVTTSLVHDFGGRRTEITRHGRTWKYGYDKNGNMIWERVPGSPGPEFDHDYVNIINYDALDRPIYKLIGPRDLSEADQAAFGGNTERFFYDIDGNMTGQLRTWASYGPGNAWGSVHPLFQIYFRVDNQGRRTLTHHQIGVAGYAPINNYFRQDFYLFGGSKVTRYGDRRDGHSDWSTQSRTFYDARGLPSRIALATNDTPENPNVAAQTRNVAGLVTKRRSTPPSGGPMTYVESNWTYDKLGRVVSQVVQKDPAPTEIARQDLTYLGNDNPASLTHWLGTSSEPFNFTFDQRHQLTNVTTTTPGYFQASYEFGMAGRFTRAAEAQTISPTPSGSEVQPRDVTYVYGGTDPEQVTALVNHGVPATTYATFTYDVAGNLKSHCLGAVSVPACAPANHSNMYTMEKISSVAPPRRTTASSRAAKSIGMTTKGSGSQS